VAGGAGPSVRVPSGRCPQDPRRDPSGLREAGHYQNAIEAKREAIAVGYRSVPDPEEGIAECLLDAGHIEEADALFATMRERDPDDVWLHDAPAYSYAGIDVAS